MNKYITIENTDLWRVDSVNNGWAYEFTHKPSGFAAWIQDDDATQWRELYNALYDNPPVTIPWNEVLASICVEHFNDVIASVK